MSALVAVLAIGCFILAYRFYAKFVGEKIYRDQDDIVTPAHEFEDGRDFVPTNKHILWGHHFTSIAGAAPIIGPCIAAYWGWLPALLWVVIGTIFMGAVHDFGALVVSLREKGRSIADLADRVLSRRARIMFLCFVLVLAWLVLAVFAMAIAGLFVGFSTAVLPVNIEIVVALVIGWLIYKKGIKAFVPSVIALAILYLFVWIGAQAGPIDYAEDLGLTNEQAMSGWIVVLFVYSAIASLLPVWLLLQPRDYINSHQLMVGLSLLFIGLIVAHPEFDAPMVRTSFEGGAPSIFPLLFVTIACGAISGFHGLIASGTTSKQVDRMAHARAIGYGGMLGEGTLAIAATMAAVAGIALCTNCTLPSIGPVESLSWEVYYDTFGHAAKNKAAAFVLGGGEFLKQLGLGQTMAQTLMAVLVVSFAATTLDTATRIQRFIVCELGGAIHVRPLVNRYVATVVAIVPAILLAMWRVPDPTSGAITSAGWILWPIFGASNQMLAALTLMVLVLYFWKRRRPVLPLLIPMVFVMAVTLASLLFKAREFLGAENWLLLSLTVVQLTLVVWMIFEGIGRIAAVRRERAAGSDGEAT